MSLGGILTVLIGLSFVFLLLSLISSWLQELIATLLRWRARDLANAIQLILDPSTQKRDAVKQLAEAWKGEDGATIRSMLRADPLKAFYDHPTIKSLTKPGALPSYIPAKEFAEVLMDLLVKSGSEPTQVAGALEQIKSGIANISNDDTRKALLSLVTTAEMLEGNAEKRVAAIRDRIAGWFDSVMERASGWYKRKSQVMSLCFGLALALLFNADAIRIGRALWNDSVLGSAVQSIVTNFLTSGKGDVSEALQAIQLAGIPLGWAQANIPGATVAAILAAILGWLLTALAVAQGSSFWFDVLGRFMNVRGTGKKPESSTTAADASVGR